MLLTKVDYPIDTVDERPRASERNMATLHVPLEGSWCYCISNAFLQVTFLPRSVRGTMHRRCCRYLVRRAIFGSRPDTLYKGASTIAASIPLHEYDITGYRASVQALRPWYRFPVTGSTLSR